MSNKFISSIFNLASRSLFQLERNDVCRKTKDYLEENSINSKKPNRKNFRVGFNTRRRKINEIFNFFSKTRDENRFALCCLCQQITSQQQQEALNLLHI